MFTSSTRQFASIWNYVYFSGPANLPYNTLHNYFPVNHAFTFFGISIDHIQLHNFIASYAVGLIYLGMQNGAKR